MNPDWKSLVAFGIGDHEGEEDFKYYALVCGRLKPNSVSHKKPSTWFNQSCFDGSHLSRLCTFLRLLFPMRVLMVWRVLSEGVGSWIERGD